jgi:hypothetical protein
MTLGRHIQKLLRLAGPALCTDVSTFSASKRLGSLEEPLGELLVKRNGFYVFESALLVRPSCRAGAATEMGVEEWNVRSLWIDGYSDIGAHCIFFAEDAFGTQFYIDHGGVFTFDPETGDRSRIATDLDGWAQELLRDYEVLTGYPLAHAWQKRNGPIPPRKRLVPKVPFVLGGEFSLDNLYLGDSVEAMRARADVARQIRDLPDGTSVSFAVDDDR